MGWRGVRGHTASFRAVSLTRTSSGGRKAVHLDLTVRHRSAARWVVVQLTVDKRRLAVAGRVVGLLEPLAGVAALAGTGLVGEQLWRDARRGIGLVAGEVWRALCRGRGFGFPLGRGGRAMAEGYGLVGWWAAWMGSRSGRNGSWTLVHHGCSAKVGGSTRGGCSPCALGGECECCSSAGRGCRIAKLAGEIVG